MPKEPLIAIPGDMKPPAPPPMRPDTEEDRDRFRLERWARLSIPELYKESETQSARADVYFQNEIGKYIVQREKDAQRYG